MSLVMEREVLFEFSHTELTVGFSGTRNGLTFIQNEKLLEAMSEYAFVTARHGDCIGADEQFDEFADVMGMCIHIHPCDIKSQRAYTKNFAIEHPVKPPLLRNQDIVRLSDALIAISGTMEEELRSGTWSTIRYAKKMGKPYRIIFPNGEVEDKLIL